MLFRQKLHPHPRQFNHIIRIEWTGPFIQGGAVDDGKLVALHMVEEVAVWAAGDHGDLHVLFADRGERFAEGDFDAALLAVEHFQRAPSPYFAKNAILTAAFFLSAGLAASQA